MLLMADAASTSRDPGGVGLDPQFVDLAVTVPGTLAHLGAKSMSQGHYGGINIAIYTDPDEALAYARQNPL